MVEGLGEEPFAGASALEPRVWTYRRAIVAFEDRASRCLLRLLAAGFRHCFCVIGDGRRWTLLDPLKGRIEILTFTGCPENELVRHLADGGRRVLMGERSAGSCPAPMPLRPLTCVEVVKRALNLDAPRVFTPLQLHGALLREFGFSEPSTDQES